MFQDISNIKNDTDLIYITTAVVLIDLIVIIIAKNSNIFRKQINVWYDKLGMTAVLLDVTIIIIGFIITRYIFSLSKIEFNPLYFIIVALIVQLIHDILLYLLIIKPIKYGTNTVIDIYKDYAKENGKDILIADSMMVLGSAIIAMLLKNTDMHVSSTLFTLGIYIIPYLIYVKK